MSQTKEQLAHIAKAKPQSVKTAKAAQLRKSRERKGYVKPLPSFCLIAMIA
jgi:hypothetical protein